MKKQVERLVFFEINDSTGFRTALRSYIPQITSTATLISPASQQPLTFVNLAFSHTGLTELGILDDLLDPYFTAGMWSDASSLGDDTSQWLPAFTGTSIHGVFIMGSDEVHISLKSYILVTDSSIRLIIWTNIKPLSQPTSEAQ